MGMLKDERDTAFLLQPLEPGKPPESLLPYVHILHTAAEWLALGFTPFEEVMTMPEDDDGDPYPSWEMCEIEIDGYRTEFELADMLEQWDWGNAFDGTKKTRYIEKPGFALALLDAGVNPSFFRGVDATLQTYFDAEVALSTGNTEKFKQLVELYLREAYGTSSAVVTRRRAEVFGLNETEMLLDEVLEAAQTMDWAVTSNRPQNWIERARDANDYSLLLTIAIQVVDGVNKVTQTDWTREQPLKESRHILRDAESLLRVDKMFDYFLNRLGSMRRVVCDQLFIQNIDRPEDLKRILLLISEKNPSKKPKIEKLINKHIVVV